MVQQIKIDNSDLLQAIKSTSYLQQIQDKDLKKAYQRWIDRGSDDETNSITLKLSEIEGFANGSSSGSLFFFPKTSLEKCIESLSVTLQEFQEKHVPEEGTLRCIVTCEVDRNYPLAGLLSIVESLPVDEDNILLETSINTAMTPNEIGVSMWCVY